MRDRQAVLFELYGSLLTDKQQEVLNLHLNEDYSLREIGEQMGSSRQAGRDLIQRSLEKLDFFEEHLELYDKLLKQREQRERIRRMLKESSVQEALIQKVLDVLEEMIEEE